MKSKKFTKLFVYFSLTSIAFIIGFNYIVDSYDIFASPKIKNFNINKIEKDSHIRIAKAMAIKKIHPQIAILGNSKSECGIDPSSKTFKDKVVYNASFYGGLPLEIEYFYNYLVKNGTKTIIMGIDFDFSYYKIKFQKGFDSTLFDNNYSIIKYLLSKDSLKHSLSTLKNQEYINQYERNGLRMPSSRQKIVNRFGGHRKTFIKSCEGYYNESVKGLYDITDNKHFKVYERIIKYSYENDIDLKLFISPSHATLWEILDKGKVLTYKNFEDWKRKLVLINRKYALLYKSKEFDLWDFTDYTEITTEVPSSLDSKPMKYYWDNAHYKKELGDMILDKIYNKNNSKIDEALYFGKKIDINNINSHLLELAIKRLNWLNNNKTIINNICLNAVKK